MTASVPGSPGGRSIPGDANPPLTAPTTYDFATHAAQVTAQTSLGDIDTSAAHLATIDTSTASTAAHAAAIDTSAAHLPTIDTSTASTATHAANIDAATALFTSTEVQHITLAKGIDTTITFAGGTMSKVRVSNWDNTSQILVKQSTITSDTDAAAARVAAAASAIIPAVLEFPFKQSALHLYNPGGTGGPVTVEGFK